MAGPEEPDVAALSALLKTVASPTRMRLLWALRVPKRAAELRIPAEDDRGGFHHDRLLSRTTLIEHLDVLERAGLIERLPDGGSYVTNQQNVFALVENLGRLASIKPVVQVDVDVTRPTQSGKPPSLPEGPRLLVVGGPGEGQTLALQGDGPWTLGRGPESDLRLDYDPHVSRLQLLLRRERAGFTVEAVREATNPARLNLAPLSPGQPAPLPPGAVLAAGASRLVFQPG